MEQEINYAEKINTFKLLIDNNSDDIALNYLQKANWDEEQAAILFNKENRTIPSDVIPQPKKPEPKVTKPTGNTNRNNPYDKFLKIPMINPSVNQSIFGKLFGWLKAKPENYNKIFDKSQIPCNLMQVIIQRINFSCLIFYLIFFFLFFFTIRLLIYFIVINASVTI